MGLVDGKAGRGDRPARALGRGFLGGWATRPVGGPCRDVGRAKPLQKEAGPATNSVRLKLLALRAVRASVDCGLWARLLSAGPVQPLYSSPVAWASCAGEQKTRSMRTGNRPRQL